MPTLSTEDRKQLLTLAQSARDLSYSPYSKFRVGCAFLMKDGSFIQGCNVENASYGGCICAERTAMVKAVSNGSKAGDFIALAVAADIDAPCSIAKY
jgi:cytidine deaminase